MKKLVWIIGVSVVIIPFFIFIYFAVTTFFYADIFLDYSQWHECDLQIGGSIKLPNKWALHNQNDNFFIITTEDVEETLFGVYSDGACVSENKKQLVYDFNNTSIRELRGGGGTALSNSTSYGKSIIKYNGVNKMCYIIQMHYSSDAYIYIIDANNLLDENLAKQIAYSYDMTS